MHHSLPVSKAPGQSFQEFVRETLTNMFRFDMLSPEEIENLQNRDYCKKTFQIEYPLLEADEDKIMDKQGHARYWTSVKFGGKYYACNDWWKQKFPEYEPLFAQWIEKINSLRK